MKSSIRNEIKAQIIRAGYTMQEVVDLLHDEYGWSDSVSNLSGKLQRESLRYREAVELADVLGYVYLPGHAGSNRFTGSVGQGTGAAEKQTPSHKSGTAGIVLRASVLSRLRE